MEGGVDWTATGVAVLSAVAAVLAAGAAWVSAHHARITVKVQLFDKRFAVFEEVMKFLLEPDKENTPHDFQRVDRFTRETRTAEYLFKSNDIAEFIDEVRSKATSLRSADEQNDPERYKRCQDELRKCVDKCKQVFNPHLKLGRT